MSDLLLDRDCDPLIFIDEINKGDLYDVSGKLYDEIKFKMSFILFILFIILNSDIFVENVLTKLFKNSYDPSIDKITEKGIIISGMFLSISYILLDILYTKHYI